MPLRFAALARVSSREQEREGFSLDVQVEALERYAERHGGRIVHLCRIAETASKQEERQQFKVFLDYCRRHATELAGVLFYKVDRAARNLFDYVELERLEVDHALPVVYVAQATENTPAGRMQRRILANMASFYTEQQSLDVQEGLKRRAESGLFVGRAPFGYLNVRRDGRGMIEVDESRAATVRRIFELYAWHGHTLDSLADTLLADGLTWSLQRSTFTRSKLHTILRDRAYIGEVKYQGNWRRGTHKPLVDIHTFERVQEVLGGKVYRAHELTYAGSILTCGHCGRPITGERVRKKSRRGVREYEYYRCTRYNASGHPRIRVRAEALDEWVLEQFRALRIGDDDLRVWFQQVLCEKAQADGESRVNHQEQVQQEMSFLRRRADKLLELRLAGEIDADTFKNKHGEIEGNIRVLQARLQYADSHRAEELATAEKVFELSQSLEAKWLGADARTKRRLLEILYLNLTLDGATPSATMRKPFDALAEGLETQNGRGDRI